MLSLFPRDVLDEISNLFESVSEGFPTYSYILSCQISIELIFYYYHHYYYYVLDQLNTTELSKLSYKTCKEEAIMADIFTLSV